MQQSPEIRAVIFDMDGVLCDSEPLINLAAIAMFREHGLEAAPEDFLPFVGAGENRYLGGVAEKYGLTLDLAEAKRRTYEIYLGLVPERLQAFPGAVEAVCECRRAGWKLAIASSADRIKVEANLRKIGLPPETWDAIVTGEDVTARKPAPDIFLAAAARIGLTPAECVVVEDAVHGIEAGKAAGMRCVAVAQTFAPEELGAADLVLSSMRDLTLENLAKRGAAIHPPPLPPGQPWGFWASLGLGCAASGVWMLAQGLVGSIGIFASMLSSQGGLNPEVIEALGGNGLLLSIATIVGAPVAVGMSWLFAAIRKGRRPAWYLALEAIPVMELCRWLLYLVAVIILSDLVTLSLNRPLVPEVMVDMYRTCQLKPLFWVALVVAAPVAEESLFRGFMFRGMAASRLGPAGAIVLTSLLWAMLHIQYDWYGIISVFVLGLVLGVARHRTGSLYAPMLMHGLSNLVATIESAVLAK